MKRNDMKESEIIESIITQARGLSPAGKMAVSKAMEQEESLFEESVHFRSLQAQIDGMAELFRQKLGYDVKRETREFPIPYCRYIIAMFMFDKGYRQIEVAKCMGMNRITLIRGARITRDILLAGSDQCITDIYETMKNELQ